MKLAILAAAALGASLSLPAFAEEPIGEGATVPPPTSTTPTFKPSVTAPPPELLYGAIGLFGVGVIASSGGGGGGGGDDGNGNGGTGTTGTTSTATATAN